MTDTKNFLSNLPTFLYRLHYSVYALILQPHYYNIATSIIFAVQLSLILQVNTTNGLQLNAKETTLFNNGELTFPITCFEQTKKHTSIDNSSRKFGIDLGPLTCRLYRYI